MTVTDSTNKRQKTRILLKVSGEALMGNTKCCYENDTIDQICDDIASSWPWQKQVVVCELASEETSKNGQQ